MPISIIFISFLLFASVYCFAFDYSRYKTAGAMAKGLGGRPVYRPGRSYMVRNRDGVEEKIWVEPDGKMAWGSLLPFLKPSAATLFLRRSGGLGFRFRIEFKTGRFSRPLSLRILRDADFNVRLLDENLRLRTDKAEDAEAYFSTPEKQQALIDLFRAGFTQLKGGHDGVTAVAKGISAESIAPEAIDLYLKHMRTF